MKLATFACLLFIYLLPFRSKGQALKSGNYILHFTDRPSKDCQIKISDTIYTDYSSDRKTHPGIIRWMDEYSFRVVYPSGQDTVSGPLKELYESWGKPYTKLVNASGDTTFFIVTFPLNPELSWSQGYYLRTNRYSHRKLQGWRYYSGVEGYANSNGQGRQRKSHLVRTMDFYNR